MTEEETTSDDLVCGGYYWIRRKLHKPWVRDGSCNWEWAEPEIARWDSGDWAIAGNDYGYPANAVEVLSARLTPPVC